MGMVPVLRSVDEKFYYLCDPFGKPGSYILRNGISGS